MNYLNLISLILTLGVDELPEVEALIAKIKGASPAHQAVVNKAVSAALAATPSTAAFPGSADASSFPVAAKAVAAKA
jgi:hypothetical protein